MLWDLDFQYQKRVVDAVHSQGVPCIMHSCGNLNKTIELMVATGIDGIMGFQPTAHNDIVQYKEKYGDDICFIGNICVTELMPKATPWQIDQEVERLIREVGRDGGFILSTCNALLHDEPIENVVTLHLAAEKYGVYPL
jgi:uroporphyrinogen decarboxylase